MLPWNIFVKNLEAVFSTGFFPILESGSEGSPDEFSFEPPFSFFLMLEKILPFLDFFLGFLSLSGVWILLSKFVENSSVSIASVAISISSSSIDGYKVGCMS